MLNSCDRQPNENEPGLVTIYDNTQLPSHSDGYDLTHGTTHNMSFSVRIVEFEDHRTLRNFARDNFSDQISSDDIRALMAFALVDFDNDLCTIHMVDQRNNYGPEWIGHELAHCVYGAWHGTAVEVEDSPGISNGMGISELRIDTCADQDLSRPDFSECIYEVDGEGDSGYE